MSDGSSFPHLLIDEVRQDVLALALHGVNGRRVAGKNAWRRVNPNSVKINDGSDFALHARGLINLFRIPMAVLRQFIPSTIQQLLVVKLSRARVVLATART